MKIKLGLWGLVLTLAVSSPVFAEDLQVAAQVDRTEISQGQVFTYSVTISGSLKESPKVQMDGFQALQVVATGQSHQIRVEKGQPRQTLVLNYTLAPTQTGTYRLGPVQVEYQGQIYETQPIEVRVTAGPSKKEPSTPAPAPIRKPRLEGGTIL